MTNGNVCSVSIGSFVLEAVLCLRVGNLNGDVLQERVGDVVRMIRRFVRFHRGGRGVPAAVAAPTSRSCA